MRDRDQGKDCLSAKRDVRRGQPPRSSGSKAGSDFREAGWGEPWDNGDRDRDKVKVRKVAGVRAEAANEGAASLATAQELAKEQDAKAKEEREKLKETRKVMNSGMSALVERGGSFTVYLCTHRMYVSYSVRLAVKCIAVLYQVCS